MIALYRVLLRTQLTRGRLIGLALLGLVAPLLGFAIGATANGTPLADGVILIDDFGLSLFVPVVTLVFASAVLGDPNEDGTLVYLWLRPVARWRIVVTALAATLTAALPLVVTPLVLAAVLTGAGTDLVVATAVSSLAATVAYAGAFMWLGLRVRRALVWGLAYVLVWEGFVARAGVTPARLALRTHSSSVLSRVSGNFVPINAVATSTAIVVCAAVAILATLLTVRRLTRQDVA